MAVGLWTQPSLQPKVKCVSPTVWEAFRHFSDYAAQKPCLGLH